MSIDLSARVTRNEAIVFTELDDTIVMMDVEEGRYYELDAVGARVWALLENEPLAGELCEALGREYEVAPETCRKDVLGFLEELNALGVVQVRPEDGAMKART